jgi:hypothetical protein
MSFDDDDYWTEAVRRTGSNSAVSGWQDLVDFVRSGRADERALSGLHAALRSLSQNCHDQLAEKRKLARLRRLGGLS